MVRKSYIIQGRAILTELQAIISLNKKIYTSVDKKFS